MGMAFLESFEGQRIYLLEPTALDVVLTTSVEYFLSHHLLLSGLLTIPLFIPRGLTKGNQVTTGRLKEIIQSSAYKSARKY